MEAYLDSRMNDIENALSNAAKYPVIGIFPGAAKVAVGALQFITALVCSILSLIPTCGSKNPTVRYVRAFLRHARSHVKHGLGNIAAGAFEAIPFVGSAMYASREMARAKSDSGLRVETGCEDKWMPYKTLIYVEIIGANGEYNRDVKKANTCYSSLRLDYLHKHDFNSPTLEQEIQFAQQAISEVLKEKSQQTTAPTSVPA